MELLIGKSCAKSGKAWKSSIAMFEYQKVYRYTLVQFSKNTPGQQRKKRWLRNKLINVTTTAKDIKRQDEEPLPMKVVKNQWTTRTKNQPTLAIGCHQGHCHQQQIGILPVGQMQSFHAGGEHLPAKRGDLSRLPLKPPETDMEHPKMDLRILENHGSIPFCGGK